MNQRKLAAPQWLLLLALFLFAGCASSKPINKSELQSQIKSAVSLSAETRLFIDHVRQNLATVQYSEAHAHYLEEQLAEIEKSTRNRTATTDTQSSLNAYHKQVNDLQSSLSAIPHEIRDLSKLAMTEQKIEKIQGELEAINSSL